MVIREVKIIVIRFLCRREGTLTWDWLRSHIDRTFLPGIQGSRLLPFCVSVIRILRSQPAEREKAASRKPLPCFLKALTRNDTDHFCSCCGKNKPHGHLSTAAGESQETQPLDQDTPNRSPTLEQHDFMPDKQPPQLEAGKMKENAQT